MDNADNWPQMHDKDGSLDTWIEQRCEAFAEQLAFRYGKQYITYQGLNERAAAIAGGLQRVLHLPPGSRVGILTPTALHYPVVFFGIIKAGMVAVPMNPQQANSALQAQLEQVQLDAVFIYPEEAIRLSATPAVANIKHLILVQPTDLSSLWWRACQRFKRLSQLAQTLLKRHADKKITRLPELLARGAGVGYRPQHLQPNSVAFVLFSSGSVTGNIKAVAYSHASALACIDQLGASLGQASLPEQLPALAALPLYHSFSLLFNAGLLLNRGASITLVDENYPLDALISLMQITPFEVISAGSSFFVDLCKAPRTHTLDFSGLKITLAGGGRLTGATERRWKSLTGNALLQAYGLTQAAPFVSVYAANKRAGSRAETGARQPLSGTRYCILDDKGQEVDIGVVGELYIQGPQLASGTLKQGELAPLALHREGWFFTGDMARSLPEGGFDVLGPKAYAVNIMGFTVYPSEVENIVSDHPYVSECAVIGLSPPAGSPLLKLYVVRSHRRLTIKALREYCRERLTHYKVPAQIEFRDYLPKNNAGKIHYQALITEASNKGRGRGVTFAMEP
ncbi:MAG: class I adenylate-forming enzyme family protein [Pontibacterium sp.]